LRASFLNNWLSMFWEFYQLYWCLYSENNSKFWKNRFLLYRRPVFY